MITLSLVFDRFSVDSSVHSVAAIYFMLFVVVLFVQIVLLQLRIYAVFDKLYAAFANSCFFFTGNSNYLQLK